MKPKNIRQKVNELLAEGKSIEGLVLPSFSSIYACRSDLRMEQIVGGKDERDLRQCDYETPKCYLGTLTRMQS